MFAVLPPSAFFALAAAVDDSCNWDRLPALAEDFLSALEGGRIAVRHELALQLLSACAFGGAFSREMRFSRTPPRLFGNLRTGSVIC